MVVAAFPVAKLGALLLKQISKPIANAVKEQAKTSPVFRKYVCLPPAQFYNWCEEKSKMWILNLGKPVNIPVYSEAMAIELGANLLGEGLIFVIAATILVAEYTRSLRKEAAKEEAKVQEINMLKDTIRDLFIQTEEQGAFIRELRRKVGDIETKVVTKPTKLKFSSEKSPPSPPQPAETIRMKSESLTPPPHILPTNLSSVTNKEDFRNEVQESASQPCTAITGTRLESHILPNLSVADVNLRSTESSEHSSLLLKAINDIEKEFWTNSNTQRRPSIVTNALHHLYKDVYRVN